MANVFEVAAQADRARARLKAAKTVVEQNSAMDELGKLADAHAEVFVPGLGGASMKALKLHLRDVKIAIERANTKTKSGHPAMGQRLRELGSERDMLIRQIREAERKIFDALEGVRG